MKNGHRLPGRDGTRAPAAAAHDVDRAISPVRAVEIAAAALADVSAAERAPFLARLERHWPDVVEGWELPYGSHRSGRSSLERLVAVMAGAFRQRSQALRDLDAERVAQPDWFQRPEMIGYVCYVDRFAGTIAGVERHVGYLDDLGIRYLHLMPLLETRAGDNDGGYAVTDYGAVQPGLGTIEDLERLCSTLRDHQISVCIDLVLNHTAAEHPWAMQALSGDPDAEAMYWIFPDRTEPDRYERTLPEVFPDFAPGNFSPLPDGRWVWTTFNEFQWDLNWSNPDVFLTMTEALLALVNRGVEVVRLDAVPFMWKELGTDCQNRPEVHDLLQALRACARIVAPAVVFKAEAIVAPSELTKYLGSEDHRGRVADLAYHNSLMVQFWSGLATKDARLMRLVLSDFPDKPDSTAWATYIRNHDDIGWAITDEDAVRAGWTGREHRAFLSAFYSGRFAGTFARGELFQYVPATGDSRISGTTASLAGIEAALEQGSDDELDLAIRRILLGYALIMAWDGLPLIYMGDEIGLLNDRSYLDDPDLDEDSRWLHRPPMDWTSARRRSTPGTVAARLFAGIRRLARARAVAPQMHAAMDLDVLEDASAAVFSIVRSSQAGPLLAVHNLSEQTIPFAAHRLATIGLDDPVDLLEPAGPADPTRDLEPYAVRWLTSRRPRPTT